MEQLAGSLVLLRPMVVEDSEGYLAAAHAGDGAADVFAHLAIGVPHHLRDAVDHITAALTARARGDRFAYAQVDRASGAFIGTTSFYEVSPATRSLAIGHTWLGRRWWRTGHNTDAKLVLLSHAFEVLGAVRVVWHTDVRNERSQAAIARLGARHEGILRKHRIRPDGTWRDTVQFAMTDDDWPSVRDRLAARLQRG